MPDFPIDPELRIRATPSIVLRRTTQAIDFIRKLAVSSSDRAWRDLLQSFEAARDEWSAMEAVVKLELLLEAEGQERGHAANDHTCPMLFQNEAANFDSLVSL